VVASAASLNAAHVRRDRAEVLFLVAVTSDIATRMQLVQRLPADSVLLLFPDHATAARAFGRGVVRTDHLNPPSDPAADPAAAIVCGGLVIDPQRQQVTWHDTLLPLTRLDREVLGCLASSPARVWSYEHLYAAVWRQAYLGDTSTLHAAVKRLRAKLRAAGVTATLQSVRGVGFRLAIDVTPAGCAPAQAAG